MNHPRTIKNRNRFSKPQLLVFVIVFSLIGYLIFKSFAAPNPSLPGDLNNDNTVNVTDMSILLSNYGTANTTADINSDGIVNILDMSILLSHYGQSVSSFTTSLAQNMTITPPYTWTFNPGVTTTAGYFFADGVQLAKITGPGPYTFTIQASTLTAGAHTLGGSWDLPDGTHVTFPQSYSVTMAGSGSTTDNSSYAAATSYSAPPFTAIRTIDVSSQSAFMTAWNNIQPGDLIKVHGVTFSGEISLLDKNLSSDAEIDFDSATKFLGPTNNQLPAVWISNDSHIRLFGGNITSVGTGIYLSQGSYILWYGFNTHNTGGAGVFLTGSYSTAIDHADLKGEVSYWSLDLSLDPHPEKGTGLHGINVADSKYGVRDSRIAIYAHDGAGGAGMEIGGSSSTDGAWNNTIYMHCVNLTMHAVSQVAGNCVQVWGDNVSGNVYKYIEAQNLQGRPYDTQGLYSGQSLSTNVVEYGLASNTNLNLSMNESIGQNVRWDPRASTVFKNVSPLP
jgi:hypothetical protein